VPALAWMLCFTVVPFLVEAAMSFWTQTRFGIVATFTLDNWQRIGAERLEGVLEKSLTRRRHEEEADSRLGEGVPYSVWTGVAAR
jgi:hypothetical protein